MAPRLSRILSCVSRNGMYNNFAAGSTLSVQPGQRASCSTFKACRGARAGLLRVGGVQLLAWFSTAAAARRLCSVQTIFAAVNWSALVQRDECRSSKLCALREPAFASSFCLETEGGLAACKTLASSKGRFSFPLAAQSAHSSPQEDQEFHRSSSQNTACLSRTTALIGRAARDRLH